VVPTILLIHPCVHVSRVIPNALIVALVNPPIDVLQASINFWVSTKLSPSGIFSSSGVCGVILIKF